MLGAIGIQSGLRLERDRNSRLHPSRAASATVAASAPHVRAMRFERRWPTRGSESLSTARMRSIRKERLEEKPQPLQLGHQIAVRFRYFLPIGPKSISGTPDYAIPHPVTAGNVISFETRQYWQTARRAVAANRSLNLQLIGIWKPGFSPGFVNPGTTGRARDPTHPLKTNATMPIGACAAAWLVSRWWCSQNLSDASDHYIFQIPACHRLWRYRPRAMGGDRSGTA